MEESSHRRYRLLDPAFVKWFCRLPHGDGYLEKDAFHPRYLFRKCMFSRTKSQRLCFDHPIIDHFAKSVSALETAFTLYRFEQNNTCGSRKLGNNSIGHFLHLNCGLVPARNSHFCRGTGWMGIVEMVRDR